MNNPLISIIIPVFNTRQYLKECIESVINQTYTNLEIITIDDGSTDGSGEILDEYRKSDPRIKVIHKKNAGVSAARNTGLSLASGDYIGFVDSDDYCVQDMFEQLVDTAMTESADAVICAFIGDKKNIDNLSMSFSSREAIIEMNKGALFMGHLPNKLLKKELLSDIKFNEDISILEDLLFLNYALLQAEKVVYINKELYYYRENMESALRNSQFKTSYLTRIDASEGAVEFFEKYLPDHVFLANKNLFNSYFLVIDKISCSSNCKEYKAELKKAVQMYKKLFDRNFLDDVSRVSKLFYRALKIGYLPYKILLDLHRLKSSL